MIQLAIPQSGQDISTSKHVSIRKLHPEDYTMQMDFCWCLNHNSWVALKIFFITEAILTLQKRST